MRKVKLRALLCQVGELNERELDELFDAVQKRQSATKALRVVENARWPLSCPSCHTERIVRNGRARGLQRYLCRACGRSFSALTGTALAGVHHKERLHVFAECMSRGASVCDTAAELKISPSTALRLRHRFLNSITEHQPKALNGMVEVDETFFRESFKGARKLPRESRHRGKSKPKKGAPKGPSKDLIPVLVARSRGGPYVADVVLPSLSRTDIKAALAPIVGPDTLLVADGSGSIASAAKDLGITFEAVPTSYGGHVRGTYHVQTVNQYHSRLKGWINHELRGVSTKHLPKYLAWMRTFAWYQDKPKPEIYLISALGKQMINTF